MAANGDFFARLRRFDAYPKTLDDFRERTFSGAAGRERARQGGVERMLTYSFAGGGGDNVDPLRFRALLLPFHRGTIRFCIPRDVLSVSLLAGCVAGAVALTGGRSSPSCLWTRRALRRCASTWTCSSTTCLVAVRVGIWENWGISSLLATMADVFGRMLV